MPDSILVLRVDATTAMGTGHVMRMLALAQAWTDAGGQARFVGHVEAPALRRRLTDEGFDLADVPATHPAPADLDALLAHSGAGQWVALDGYHFDAAYMRALRDAGRKTLVADDVCDRSAYDADILLNQNLGAEAYRYPANADALTLLGPRFALLRREFAQDGTAPRPCPARARNILVTFGGSDPDNVTGQALEALSLIGTTDLEATVVAGGANPHADALTTQAAALPFACEVLRAVDDMPGLMRWADLAISASGSTCWELCHFGVPMLIAAIADNQRGVAAALDKAGAAVRVQPRTEELAAALAALLDDAPRRRSMSVSGRTLVDGQGAKRVAQAMRGRELRLRPAGPKDSGLLLAWRNHPSARAQSFNTGAVGEAEHAAWLAARLADPDCLLFIAETPDGVAVGQLRFDITTRRARISIQVDPERQARGLGAAMLRTGCAALALARPGCVPEALVKPGNAASAAMFLTAGFRQCTPEPAFAQQHLRFELREAGHGR